MKTSLKKSLLLIGVALTFVATAWAYDQDPGWFDKNVEKFKYCLNGGTFRVISETAHSYYGFCECPDNYIGQKCEYELE